MCILVMCLIDAWALQSQLKKDLVTRHVAVRDCRSDSLPISGDLSLQQGKAADSSTVTIGRLVFY
jgi:hypothetical protein